MAGTCPYSLAWAAFSVWYSNTPLFGFTAAYRRLFVARATTAVRAQVIMIAVATLLFAPTLTEGRGFAIAAAGADAPTGTQVLVGASLRHYVGVSPEGRQNRSTTPFWKTMSTR